MLRVKGTREKKEEGYRVERRGTHRVIQLNHGQRASSSVLLLLAPGDSDTDTLRGRKEVGRVLPHTCRGVARDVHT